MSSRRPEIFVSATSADLRSCRQTVKEGLLTLGCVPVEQGNFPPDYRTVREMLRTKIAACDAVIHVAGECHGAEPAAREPDAPRRSYTQLEFDLARELGKPLYVFLCGRGFPYDEHAPEAPDKQQLQQAHRAALAASDTLRSEVASRDELALRVRELQTHVERLQRELRAARSWLGRGVAAGLLLLVGLGGSLWWLNRRAVVAESRVATLETEFERQRRFVQAVADAYRQQEMEFAKLQLSDDAKLSRALDTVVKREHRSENDYTKALTAFVADVRANPNAAARDRVLADFAQKKLLEALAARLEALASKFRPTGTVLVKGRRMLTFGNRFVREGSTLIVTFAGEEYEVQIAAIGPTSFTLRLGADEVVRPIASPKNANVDR